MVLKWTILFVEMVLGIISVIQSYGDGHGMFNGGVSWDYPECGRKATKCYGVLQLILLLITGIEYLFLKTNTVVTIISAVLAFLIPFVISVSILYKSAKKEAINDELYRKEQIRKEETGFYVDNRRKYK